MNRQRNKGLVSFVVVISSLFLWNILYQPCNILIDADFLSAQLSFERPDSNYLPVDKKVPFLILSRPVFEFLPGAGLCAFATSIAPISHSPVKQDLTLRC
jgi:hypothetical protein